MIGLSPTAGKVGPGLAGTAFDLSAPVAQLAAATHNPVPSTQPTRPTSLLSWLGFEDTPPASSPGANEADGTGKVAPASTRKEPAGPGKVAPATTRSSATSWTTYLQWAVVVVVVALVLRVEMQRFGAK